MAALIGALRVSLSADTVKFESGMRRAQATARSSSSGISKSLGGIKAGFAGLAAGLSIGLVTRAISSALDYAGSLGELASTLGLTTRDLQTFSFAAGQVGISQEELNVGIQKLTVSMGKAQAGSKAQIDAFNAIGISVDQLKNKTTGDIFRLIAAALEKVSDRSQRAAIEVALFGKAGAKLDNLLSGTEGGLNALSDAAEKLGIVLSDDQIQKADQAADKLRAVKTVISANIAGVVADNADAILELANAFGQLVAVLARAVGWIARASSELARLGQTSPSALAAIEALIPGAGAAHLLGALVAGGKGGQSVTTKLPPVTKAGGKGATIGQFLAPDGPKAKTDTSARDALNAAHSFDEQIRQGQQDILRAQQDLASDYVERTTIGIEILNAEKDAFDAEQRYKIALFKLTKGKEGLTEAHAAQLKAQFDIRDSLERQKLLQDEQTKRAEDFQELTQHDFDRQRETLQARADLAETASERRKVELELLSLAYQLKKQALQNIIDTSKDFKEIEDARRDLAGLGQNFALDRQGVVNNTRGPMEDFLASLPTTAAKANEALQALEVQGFNGLIDSVLALSEGVGSATDSLLETLKNFLLGLARLELQRALGNILQSSGGVTGIFHSIFGGGSGLGKSLFPVVNGVDPLAPFASGGFTGNISPNKFAGFVHGREGVLNTRGLTALGIPNLNALNRGVPMSALMNDNAPTHSGGGNTYMTVNTPDADSFRRSAGQITRSWQRRLR